MPENFPIPAACPLFEGLTPSQTQQVLQCLGARAARYAKGQTILREGQPPRLVGIVLEGAVQITRDDYFGNRTIVDTLTPGHLFGEAYACAQAPALPVNLLAAEDCCTLLLDCRRLLTPCAGGCGFHTQLISNLVLVLARKNVQLNRKIEVTSQRTTRQKLLTYLSAQAAQAGSRSFTIPYNRQALADYLGVERSAMAAEISRLRQEGILQSTRSRFTLL